MPAENITITAKWDVNRYTITFNSNGGSAVSAITQNYGTAITAPANPTKTGYTFAGWDKVVPVTMPAENITITAKWDVNRYTITFNSNGGSAVSAITQNYGTAITAPANPTKTGYTFAGWYSNSSLTTKYNFTTMPANNITLYAKWTVNQYTLRFVDIDGTVLKEYVKKDYGTAITAPASLAKTGYTFDGWDKTVPETMPAYDMTITAKRTLYSSAIKYEAGNITVNGQTVKGEFKLGNVGINSVSIKVSQLEDAEATMYSQYNNFLGWCLTPNYDETKMLTDANGKLLPNVSGYTNAKGEWIRESFDSITLYAQCDLRIIYDNIATLPSEINDERVVIDWSNSTVTDVKAARQNGILDINRNAKEVIFIGDSNLTFTNFAIRVADFYSTTDDPELTIRFMDFNYVTDIWYAFHSAYESSYDNFSLTIEVIGDCSINSGVINGDVIVTNDADLSFIGDGKMEIAASDGDSSSNGRRGVVANNVSIFMPKGTLIIKGGNGGHGRYNGDGKDGGPGGHGGNAIECSSLTISSGNVTLIGGNGGNGAEGGGAWGNDDGDGGNGGDAGLPVSKDAIKNISSAKVVLAAGNFGFGGGAYDAGVWGSAGKNAPIKAEIYFGNKKYILHEESKTWAEAQDYAESLGGYLVTITSAEEHEIVKELISYRYEYSDFYIGASRPQGSGLYDWEWVTGEKFEYNLWGTGEPNNRDGNELYLAIYAPSGIGFADYPDGYRAFITEYDING